MSKLSFEDKINLYEDKLNGLSYKSLSIKYKIRDSRVKYLVRLIEIHGYDILRKYKNNNYPKYIKEDAINSVLVNKESIYSVALRLGLSSDGMLYNWISKYKENGYNIVERKRGRSPTMFKKSKQITKKETIEEENERLRKENEYLKAELEYSKKLRAVVQARKNRQQKKK